MKSTRRQTMPAHVYNEYTAASYSIFDFDFRKWPKCERLRLFFRIGVWHYFCIICCSSISIWLSCMIFDIMRLVNWALSASVYCVWCCRHRRRWWWLCLFGRLFIWYFVNTIINSWPALHCNGSISISITIPILLLQFRISLHLLLSSFIHPFNFPSFFFMDLFPFYYDNNVVLLWWFVMNG